MRGPRRFRPLPQDRFLSWVVFSQSRGTSEGLQKPPKTTGPPNNEDDPPLLLGRSLLLSLSLSFSHLSPSLCLRRSITPFARASRRGPRPQERAPAARRGRGAAWHGPVRHLGQEGQGKPLWEDLLRGGYRAWPNAKPHKHAECELCRRRCPQRQGRLGGSPGRPRSAQFKFLCTPRFKEEEEAALRGGHRFLSERLHPQRRAALAKRSVVHEFTEMTDTASVWLPPGTHQDQLGDTTSRLQALLEREAWAATRGHVQVFA